MKLVFSEAAHDYGRYFFPYIVWAVPEPGDTPADCFERGFALSSPQLDRFVLCRHLRVDLRRHQPSSENRRILRKGHTIATALLPRAAFDVTPQRREAWRRFADERFGEGVMSDERLDRLLAAPVINRVLTFEDPASRAELGTALLYVEERRAAYYYYAFYDLNQRHRNLGMFMMTRAVSLFAELGFDYLYLGTCYSERSLYKTQFPGIQFFNGKAWSDNLEELKYILRRHPAAAARHLFEDPAYLELFPGSLRL
jgi:arginyl-tRNA--protein-N-Asp/Glu arginylyltransferase